MTSADFYKNLPVLDEFAAIADEANYHPIPPDWSLVVTDIAGSTRAIREGRYKEVNLVGAAAITGVLHAVKPMDVPFVFGGDGAMLAVPDACAERAKAVLRAARRMAERQFGLTLRAGVVPVRRVHATHGRVLVARYRVSPHYTQAVFAGGGMRHAEALVKDDEMGWPYRVESEDGEAAGCFDGLECRWEDIPSPYGETISLLVQATAAGGASRSATYRRVIEEIGAVYGDADRCRPVRLDALRITQSSAKLRGEVKVRAGERGRIGRALYWLSLRAQTALASVLFPRNMRFAGVDWGRYQRDVVANTDFRKFDDLLREVLSGTPEQRERLTRFLDERVERGELVYGLHAAPSALMTCLLFNRHGEHVHFVDGSAGGYAMASQQLKERAQARRLGTGQPA